jgi:glycine cleavage system transcriptional repressor
MGLFAVTVVGHDAPGIIAAVTGVLADLGGNLEDSSMTLLRGHFAMTLLVTVDREQAEVQSAVAAVTEPRGLLLWARAVPPERDTGSPGTHHVLTVHGGDRPGIVSAVTAVIANRGGNVTDLTTRLTGELYLLVAEVDLPPGADAEALAGELTVVAAGLGVEATLRPIDADVL